MSVLDQLENKHGFTLPRSYRRWFENGGPNHPDFIGTDMDEGLIGDLNQWAEELLAESESNFKLPDNAFVFAMHQGYIFMYFICNGIADPEVWYYHEGDPEPRVKWSSFSDFLASQ